MEECKHLLVEIETNREKRDTIDVKMAATTKELALLHGKIANIIAQYASARFQKEIADGIERRHTLDLTEEMISDSSIRSELQELYRSYVQYLVQDEEEKKEQFGIKERLADLDKQCTDKLIEIGRPELIAYVTNQKSIIPAALELLGDTTETGRVRSILQEIKFFQKSMECETAAKLKHEADLLIYSDNLKKAAEQFLLSPFADRVLTSLKENTAITDDPKIKDYTACANRSDILGLRKKIEIYNDTLEIIQNSALVIEAHYSIIDDLHKEIADIDGTDIDRTDIDRTDIDLRKA